MEKGFSFLHVNRVASSKGSELREHMNRFQYKGKDHGLLTANMMEEYVVLDFTVSRLSKAHPGTVNP